MKDITLFQERVHGLIKEKDNRYNIIRDQEVSDRLLLREGSEEIGHVTSSYDKKTHTCNISWLIIEPGHQGKGLGTLLLIYGMLQAKIDHDDIEKFTLDDDSDQSTSMGKNIYNKLGFIGDILRMETSRTASLYGPEKEAYFPNFLVRALQTTGLSQKYNSMYKQAVKNQVHNRVFRSRAPHTIGGKSHKKRQKIDL